MTSRADKKGKERQTIREEFTAEDFNQALGYLDKEMEQSKNLRKAAPIKIIAVGGYVSVTYLQNRATTEDVDYILDPAIENAKKVEEKLLAAVERVAKSKGYTDQWVNNKVSQFAVGSTRQPLFQESVSQGVILWKGKNLIVYAVKWEWSLARKLKRIGSTGRDVDISDAVAILNVINKRNKKPLDWKVAKGWDVMVYSPIEDHVLEEVARRYKATYGRDGLIKMSPSSVVQPTFQASSSAGVQPTFRVSSNAGVQPTTSQASSSIPDSSYYRPCKISKHPSSADVIGIETGKGQCTWTPKSTWRLDKQGRLVNDQHKVYHQ